MVKTGDTIKVHYKGTLNDGTLFDSSEGREPLEFEVGSGMVIKGFDDGVMGMAVGEKKSVNIPAKEAYGEANPQMIFDFEKAQIPNDIPLEVGGTLNMHNGQQTVPVKILEVAETTIKLDANHPLAGQDLNFDLELVDIQAGGNTSVNFEEVK
ncbi:FKBP-type peptidyl-prolyl cis-trans isomerase [Jiulongibacter sp. NS-SX5]|uniref:FKBP-type peptidyl-prolyl cis-trans isomerase n=1 Tax=Jiulongibacter sp. NS-SX5 TaxID=3463854 RepID=UPI004059805C